MGNQVDREFTWVIKNLQSAEIRYSDSFVIGGCKWRLVAYPYINRLSYLYLEVADCLYFPSGWRRQANVSLTIYQVSKIIYRRQVTQQWVDHKTPCLGFTSLGFRGNVEVEIVAEIDVLEVTDKVYVNGFQVLHPQVKSLNCLFEKHPDIASNFLIKNQLLKTAYMNVLLSLTETLRVSSPQKISEDDLSDAEITLAYMTNVGFKLDWLEKKLGEVKEKKAKEKAGEIRMQDIEEQLKDLKHKCSNLEAQLEKERAEVLAARAPLSLSDDDDV